MFKISIANQFNTILFEDIDVNEFVEWFMDSIWSDKWKSTHPSNTSDRLKLELNRKINTLIKKNLYEFEFEGFTFFSPSKVEIQKPC